MLGGSELDLSRVRGVLTEWEPLAHVYWDPSQKHDGPLVFAANVTLDEATAHPVLLLSEEGKWVTWQNKYQDLPSSTQRFDSVSCVLGQLSISSGRQFSEMQVGNTCSWDLGVCRDNVRRKGRVPFMSPQNGFWAIRLYEGEYCTLTAPATPLTVTGKPLSVRVYLEYEAGDVSFYDVTDRFHIFTFHQNTFSVLSENLFRCWSSGHLTICPGEGK